MGGVSACTRRLKTRTLLFGEGTCLLGHIDTLESRPKTKTAKSGKSLPHLKTSSPWVGRLHAVQKPPLGVGGGGGPDDEAPHRIRNQGTVP